MISYVGKIEWVYTYNRCAKHRIMEVEEYIRNRIDDQLKFYALKARIERKKHLFFQMYQLIMILSIPVLLTVSTVYKGFSQEFINTIVIVISIFAAVITAYLNVYKPESKWIEYQRIAEELKREKFNFKMKVGSYAELDTEKESVQVFIERIENILSSQKSRWLNSVNLSSHKE